jgi:hypothetical protein
MTQEPAPSQKRPRTGFVPEELAVDLEHLDRVTEMLASRPWSVLAPRVKKR